MNKSPLCIHQVELSVQSDPSFSDGGVVGKAANGASVLSQIAVWDDRWRLVVDSDLKNK
jgi:hypothetical protein